MKLNDLDKDIDINESPFGGFRRSLRNLGANIKGKLSGSINPRVRAELRNQAEGMLSDFDHFLGKKNKSFSDATKPDLIQFLKSVETKHLDRYNIPDSIVNNKQELIKLFMQLISNEATGTVPDEPSSVDTQGDVTVPPSDADIPPKLKDLLDQLNDPQKAALINRLRRN